MQKEFVTHTIALKLKELGFNEPCFGYYTPIKSWMIQGTKINPEPHFHGPNWSNVDNTFYFMYKTNSFGDRTEVVYNSYFTKAIYNIAVPLWQQVTAWFRNKYKMSIEINLIDNCIEYYYEYSIVCSNNRQHNDGEMLDQAEILYNDLKFKFYEEAREAAILKAIELRKTIHN